MSLPLKVAFSGCLAHEKCNYRGADNPYLLVHTLLKCCQKRFEVITICPEALTMGVPREPMNLVGGDGFAVLEGSARVLTHSGRDMGGQMLEGARQSLKVCQKAGVTTVVLMEGSPSCGSTWVFDGQKWPEKVRREGMGVAAALLSRSGLEVISALDSDALRKLLRRVQDLPIHENT